jgi:hypothetical protein
MFVNVIDLKLKIEASSTIFNLRKTYFTIIHQEICFTNTPNYHVMIYDTEESHFHNARYFYSFSSKILLQKSFRIDATSP